MLERVRDHAQRWSPHRGHTGNADLPRGRRSVPLRRRKSREDLPPRSVDCDKMERHCDREERNRSGFGLGQAQKDAGFDDDDFQVGGGLLLLVSEATARSRGRPSPELSIRMRARLGIGTTASPSARAATEAIVTSLVTGRADQNELPSCAIIPLAGDENATSGANRVIRMIRGKHSSEVSRMRHESCDRPPHVASRRRRSAHSTGKKSVIEPSHLARPGSSVRRVRQIHTMDPAVQIDRGAVMRLSKGGR